jgi:hypothetical protein
MNTTSVFCAALARRAVGCVFGPTLTSDLGRAEGVDFVARLVHPSSAPCLRPHTD